jgi:hypothetical protein
MTKLLDVIADARRSVKASLDSLTVMSRSKDPYRICDGTDGRWFAEQMERFASMLVRIHLRGLHYRIVAAGDVLRPNGEPYVNDDKCWTWLSDDAAKAARWLGLVPFDRTIDERNAPPFIYVPDDVPTLSWSLAMGDAAYDLCLLERPSWTLSCRVSRLARSSSASPIGLCWSARRRVSPMSYGRLPRPTTPS